MFLLRPVVPASLAVLLFAGCNDASTPPQPQPVVNAPSGGTVKALAARVVEATPVVAGVGSDGKQIRYGDSVPYVPRPVARDTVAGAPDGQPNRSSVSGGGTTVANGGGVKVGGATPVGRFTAVDLSSKANLGLAQPPKPNGRHDGLADLPIGPGTYDGIPFTVGAKYLHVGSQASPSMPDAVEGIPLGRTVGKLHFLQACASSGLGKPGPKQPDGSVIGGYVVHYTDGTTANVPVHYGRDVRDWWNWDGNAPTSPGRIAWEGENSYAKKLGKNVRLYHGVWTNPSPTKSVESIDFLTAGSIAAPFCVAITIEGS